jgi:hypothetical protein
MQSKPRNRSEAAKFARVYEILDDGSAVRRGEWLSNFPKYRNLSAEDLADWENWVNGLGADRFLNKIIEFCAQYTDNSVRRERR